MRIDLLGALESNNSLRVARVEEEVRPVAGVSLFIVGKARFAIVEVRVAISTLDVVRAAVRAFWVDSVLVLTSRRANRHQNSLPWATVYSPVVVAVVVDSAFPVIEKTVLALLQGESAVGAEVEVVAGFWVSVRLDAMLLWAPRSVQDWDSVRCGDEADRNEKIGRAHV